MQMNSTPTSAPSNNAGARVSRPSPPKWACRATLAPRVPLPPKVRRHCSGLPNTPQHLPPMPSAASSKPWASRFGIPSSSCMIPAPAPSTPIGLCDDAHDRLMQPIMSRGSTKARFFLFCGKCTSLRESFGLQTGAK